MTDLDGIVQRIAYMSNVPDPPEINWEEVRVTIEVREKPRIAKVVDILHGIEHRQDMGDDWVELRCDEADVWSGGSPVLSRMLHVKALAAHAQHNTRIEQRTMHPDCPHMSRTIDDKLICSECIDQGMTDWVSWTLSFFEPEL